MTPRLTLALKLAISAACLAAVWAFFDPAVLAARLRRVSPWPLAGAALLNLAQQALNAAKLKALFPPPRPAFRGLFEANCIAMFFGAFLPGGVGGEAARWAYLSRAAGSAGRALAGILLDRLTGLWTQILFVLLAAAWLLRERAALWLTLPAAAGAFLLCLAAGVFGYRRGARLAARAVSRWARGRGAAFADDLGPALDGLLAGRKRLAAVAALSGASQLLVMAYFMLLDAGLGGTLTWAQAALFVFCYTFAVLPPVTAGNWGLSEGVLGALYRSARMEGAAGVLLSLLMRAAALPVAALGWGYFLLRKGKEDRA
jgi:hypothetical protein